MKDFARLLDALSFQPGRNAKLRLIEAYLKLAPDPDRGWALAALTGALSLPNAKAATLRELGAQQAGETLFALSYDYVGDLAETLALVWQPTKDAPRRNDLSLSAVIDGLQQASRREVLPLLTGWLDQLNATERWALLKLITGGLRVGVSARLAKQAAANVGQVPVEEVEEIWHGLTPPYRELFAWLDGRAERPDALAALAFRPLMLAHPLAEGELVNLDPAQFAAEWKWDGIRVQLASDGDTRRLYSRGSDDASNAFPDIVEHMDFDAVLDGELLVAHRDGEALRVAPFNELQQRLNRKTVTAKMLQDFPAHVRLYDILFEDGEDLRALPFAARRQRLEDWHARNLRPRFDLSPLIEFAAWDELEKLRESARAASIEGLMLKRKDSPYLAGRVKGHWYKWKRDTLTADCVLMYAQRGHGKRSSFYSDFTFGCWRPVDPAAADGANRSADATGRELVPVGKAYSGYTDEELKKLDKFVRDNTIDRFGPVRVLAPKLVVEVEFDAVQLSTRHKSGLAMRFPRFHRIRWDKPVAEADEVEVLRGMVE